MTLTAMSDHEAILHCGGTMRRVLKPFVELDKN